MTLSNMTVRHARITGNNYVLGDTDELALNVTAHGGKVWRGRVALFGLWQSIPSRRCSIGDQHVLADKT